MPVRPTRPFVPAIQEKRRGIAFFDATILFGENSPADLHLMTRSNNHAEDEWEDLEAEPRQPILTKAKPRPSSNDRTNATQHVTSKARDPTAAGSRRRAPLVVVIPPSRSSHGTCEQLSPEPMTPDGDEESLQWAAPALPDYTPLTPTGHKLHESGPNSPHLAWQNARTLTQTDRRPSQRPQDSEPEDAPARTRAKPKLSLNLGSRSPLHQSLTGDYAEPLSATLKRLGAKRVTRLHRGDGGWEQPSEEWFKAQRSNYLARSQSQSSEAADQPTSDLADPGPTEYRAERRASPRKSTRTEQSRRSLSTGRVRRDDSRRRTGKGDGWGGLLAPRDWFKRYSLGPLRSPLDLEAVADDADIASAGPSKASGSARQDAASDTEAWEDVNESGEYSHSAAPIQSHQSHASRPILRSDDRGEVQSYGRNGTDTTDRYKASTPTSQAWHEDDAPPNNSPQDKSKRRVRFTSGVPDMMSPEPHDSRLSPSRLLGRSKQAAALPKEEAIPMRTLSTKGQNWKAQEAEEEATRSPSIAGSAPLPLYSPPMCFTERETSSRDKQSSTLRSKAELAHEHSSPALRSSWSSSSASTAWKGKAKASIPWSSMVDDGGRGRYPPRAAYLDPYPPTRGTSSPSCSAQKRIHRAHGEEQHGFYGYSDACSDSEDAASEYEARSHSRRYRRRYPSRDPYRSRRRLFRAGLVAMLFFMVLLAVTLGVTLRVMSHDLQLAEETVDALEDELRSGAAATAALTPPTSTDNDTAAVQTTPISVVTVTAPAATPTNDSSIISADTSDDGSSIASSVASDSSPTSTTATTSYHTAAVESAVAQANGDEAVTASV